MTKLRFDNLTLNQFNSFKLIPKKKIRTDDNKKLTAKLVKGTCVKIDDEYNIQIDVKELKPEIIDKGQPDILVLPFTEESYDLKDIRSVFYRKPDKKNGYIRYIRSESQAKFSPGNPEVYVPFCPNWICSGYIVRRNGKLMFDFNECICPVGYSAFIREEDDD